MASTYRLEQNSNIKTVATVRMRQMQNPMVKRWSTPEEVKAYEESAKSLVAERAPVMAAHSIADDPVRVAAPKQPTKP